VAGAGRGRTIAVWVLSALLAGVYVLAGVPKLIGVVEAVEGFARAGLPGWFRVLIGAIEIGCGIGLLIPHAAFYAAGILGVIMIGAVFTSVRTGEYGFVVVSIICLVLLGVAAYLHRPQAGGPA
jgi:putative oxidoreductase